MLACASANHATTASASSVALTVDTLSSVVNLNAGDYLEFTVASTWSSDPSYYTPYTPRFYFPFCDCYIDIVGSGDPVYNDRTSYGPTFYNAFSESATDTTLTISDTAGHSESFSGLSSASGSVSLLFADPGIYSLSILATTSTTGAYYGTRCNYGWGQSSYGSYDAWCTDVRNYNNPTSGTDIASQSATINVSPVPLPAAVWLFGSALAGLGFLATRRRERLSV